VCDSNNVPHARRCATAIKNIMTFFARMGVGDNVKGPRLANARLSEKGSIAVKVEVCAPPVEHNQRAPIKMVSGHAWSPGIYWALRLLGKSLYVEWERMFICLSLLIHNLRLLSYTWAQRTTSMVEAGINMLHQHY
jgi:hypothetical protein